MGPKNLKGTVIPFKFNDWEDLKKVVKKNAKECAAIVFEPCREYFPEKKYLKELRKVATENNCVLIFDEITSGWRLNSGGAHKVFGINPDMVIYGKTIANGIPMGAIIGKKKIMDCVLKTFVSSALWTEKVGPASALAFIKKHKKLNVLKKIGRLWDALGASGGRFRIVFDDFCRFLKIEQLRLEMGTIRNENN